MSTIHDAFKELATKSSDERVQAIREATRSMSDDQKKELVSALGSFVPPPDQSTSNRVWLIVIWAFVISMIGAAVTLFVSVFVAPIKDGTKPETILTVFTTITAFLAGLFAPSPVTGKKGDTSS